MILIAKWFLKKTEIKKKKINRNILIYQTKWTIWTKYLFSYFNKWKIATRNSDNLQFYWKNWRLRKKTYNSTFQYVNINKPSCQIWLLTGFKIHTFSRIQTNRNCSSTENPAMTNTERFTYKWRTIFFLGRWR